MLKEEQVFYAHGFYVGNKTNNEAEYIALLLGVYICKSVMNVDDIVYIASDSQLVIKQLSGEFRVTKPTIRVLYDAARVMLNGMNYSLCHIRREYNARADELANIGIDKKNNLPHDFVRYVHAHNIVF